MDEFFGILILNKIGGRFFDLISDRYMVIILRTITH